MRHWRRPEPQTRGKNELIYKRILICVAPVFIWKIEYHRHRCRVSLSVNKCLHTFSCNSFGSLIQKPEYFAQISTISNFEFYIIAWSSQEVSAIILDFNSMSDSAQLYLWFCRNNNCMWLLHPNRISPCCDENRPRQNKLMTSKLNHKNAVRPNPICMK